MGTKVLNIHKIKLIGLNTFYVRSELDDKQIEKRVKEFDKERGRNGFFMLKSEEKYSLMKSFCEQQNVELVYFTCLDREIKIRERDKHWLQRRLKDLGYEASLVQIVRYMNGKTTPHKAVMILLQNLLEFKWE